MVGKIVGMSHFLERLRAEEERAPSSPLILLLKNWFKKIFARRVTVLLVPSDGYLNWYYTMVGPISWILELVLNNDWSHQMDTWIGTIQWLVPSDGYLNWYYTMVGPIRWILELVLNNDWSHQMDTWIGTVQWKVVNAR